MSMSLREQLLAAGFGAKKRARDDEQHKPKQSHAQRPQEQHRKGDEHKAERHKVEQQRRAAQAQAEKAAREAERNRRRQEQLERKARWEQIKQVIEQHRLPRGESEEYFNFIDRRKVRRIALDGAMRERLIAGELAIARCEGRYDVVPAPIATELRALDERAVVSLDKSAAPSGDRTNTNDHTGDHSADRSAEDDPYKDFVVPDDLRW